MMRQRSRAIFFFTLVFTCVSAISQGAQVPSSVNPGIVTRSLETHARAPNVQDVFINPSPEQARGRGSTRKIFMLKGVVLDESTVYKQADVQAIWSQDIGKKVSFSDLDAIARALTRRYREDGYVFSRVILPPQKISGGVVHFRAVEGRVSDVRLEGDFADKNGLLRSLADKLRTSAPANIKDVERYLLLMNDVPGITARAFMQPSKTLYGGTLIVAVTEKKTEGLLGFDNRGSRYIGPWRGRGQVALNDAFGLHDRTVLRGDFATQLRELKYGEISHEEQIGANGAHVTARYAVTATEPGGALNALGVEGDSTVFDVEAAYPLLRSRGANISLLTGVQANDTTTDLAGINIAEDRIRALRVGGHADAADAWLGVNTLDMTLTQGLGILGATANGAGRSRANAKRGALIWQATATRTQDLPFEKLSLYVLATGQYAGAPLLAAQEFTVGGAQVGRAYDAGELAGDRGYAGAIELRYGAAVQNKVLQAYQAYAFADYGRVFNLLPVVGEEKDDSLSSAGFGLRFTLARNISGYAELAKPLNKKVSAEGNKRPRVFFSIIKQF